MGNKEKHNYFAGIDSLRAFAVLSVIIYHLDASFLRGGFAGVDVFFVISGYVVSGSLFRTFEPSFLRLTLGFYARRVLRILPPLVIMLVIFSILSALFIPSAWLSDTNSQTALAAFFGYSNFALIWFFDGYFSPRVEFNPFLHTWSLGVEEQFYIFFPLIFFIWMKYKDTTKSMMLISNWILVLLFATSLFYAWYETPLHPDNAFYLLPSRFWELASGALLFKLHANKKLIANSHLKSNLCLLTGLLLISLGFVFADKSSFPFPWALLLISGTLLLISALVNKTKDKSSLHKFFENKILVYIGKISYSLYLWHWPIYVLFRWTVGLESILNMIIVLFLSFLLAIMSYHFIETPIKENKFIKKKKNWLILLVTLMILCLSYGFSKLVFNSQPIISLSVTKEKKIWYPHSYPSDIKPVKKKTLVGKTMFVIGDSHAGAYSTMLGKFSEEYDVKIHMLSTGGCSVANLILPSTSMGQRCVKNTNFMLSEIERLSSPDDIIFLASLRMNRLGDQWKNFEYENPIEWQLTKEAYQNRKQALKEAIKIINVFQKKSLHVVIDAPKPVFKSPAFRCSDWFNKSNPICKNGLFINRNFLLEYRKPVMNSLEKLSKEFPNLTVWDPFPILCRSNTCSAFKDNKPLFFDGDHLSAYGNRVLYKSFKLTIEGIFQYNSLNH